MTAQHFVHLATMAGHTPAGGPLSGLRADVAVSVIVVADGNALAMAAVVDLIAHDNGTIVHIDLLPVTVDAYLASVERIAGTGH